MLTLAAGGRAAESLEEVRRVHVEVVGGRERIEALAAIRATGVIFLEEARVNFTLTVARPNRLRLEGESNGRKYMQAFDGIDIPWQMHSNGWPVRSRSISEPSATQIMVDAEYDGPLISGAARGFSLQLAGETERDGRRLLAVRVDWRRRENYTLLLDPETCLIAYRIDLRPLAEGQTEETVTRYDDYRPINGVLIPHDVITTVNGRFSDRMRVDHIEPNPPLPPDLFVRPDRAAVAEVPDANGSNTK